MATKFKIWVDDTVVADNTQAANDFADDSQRESGFQSGVAASAIRVNTALRQANLVACALMEALLPNNTTLDLRSSVESVRSALKNTVPFKDSSITALTGYSSNESIETRLTNLGFKSGVISFAGVNYGSTSQTDTSQNGVYKIGKFVIGHIRLTDFKATQSKMDNYFTVGKTLFTLPNDLLPKDETYCMVGFTDNGSASNDYGYAVRVKIQQDGKGVVEKESTWGWGDPIYDNRNYTVTLCFGFELNVVS